VKKNKTLKVLATSAMLASVAAPFSAGVASANSSNLVDKVLSVSSNYAGNLNATETAPSATANNLIIKEDDTDFATGDTFRVTLPSGAEWYPGLANNSAVPVNTIGGTISATGTKISPQTIEVKFNGGGDLAQGDQLAIPLGVKLNGASGELKARIDSVDSTLTSGEYTFAVANSGKTTAVAETVESIGSTGTGGRIRVEETAINATASGTKTFTLKLPSNYEWNGMTGADFTFAGDFTGTAAPTVTGNGTNTLTVTANFANATGTSRGYFYITPKIKANKDAAKGDVTVNISGADLTDADVVVAKYADWGVNVNVESVEEITAGKFDENTKTAKITIEEAVPGSFVANRDLDVELPSWVKIVGISDYSVTGGVASNTAPAIVGDDNELSIPITGTTSTTKGKIEFKLQLSAEANKSGDIEALVSGAGVGEQKVVVAKAVAPVTASIEGEVAKLKIGAQDQEGPVFYITETKKGTFEKNSEYGTNNGEIVVTLPEGVKFSKTPKVEVVEGDGSIDTNNVRRINDDNQLSIPVKGESIKPVKIKVSDVRLTVDRTVPEGPIQAKIGGTAIVENNAAAGGWVNGGVVSAPNTNLQAGEFNTSNAVTFDIANTVTPAPGDTTASNIVFKLNSKTFTVDGKEMEMDAAPLVGWDRAYLPVRFAANALNVSDDQIIWDDKTSTFTVFKGDRVVSGKVGDKFLTVNGAKVPMDVPVWRNKAQTNNRVMVPIRYLANALNANIEWNKETSEITIQATK
jgi:hypothetical protein